ncbi:hypothetical protein HMPREF0083_01388 [Aneurinibacillus aneurinilyticus ATCC 12856]|jgi:hypothetical protein|uniref:Uncharacterized protein n=1 Tax=Aneurinibacillus aneurinilyticus ATCC 12856 TaxID=649747 RepID=U1YEG4_ANEAE|nr:hypothetical protein HMPREF0083_01388 [Aneurinibacillus aneurinilyticus ATCC 12856]
MRKTRIVLLFFFTYNKAKDSERRAGNTLLVVQWLTVIGK